MKDNSTILAIFGVIAITLAVVIASVVTKQPVDTGLLSQVITGLLAFSSGVSATMVASAIKSSIVNKE